MSLSAIACVPQGTASAPPVSGNASNSATPAVAVVRTEARLPVPANTLVTAARPIPPSELMAAARLHAGEVHPNFQVADSEDTITINVQSAK
jgi:hypothetical protein